LGGLCPGSGYRTAGSNQQFGSPSLLAVTDGAVATGNMAAGVMAAGAGQLKAAFGVFFWFEVLDFDRFFGFLPFLHD
jgi:hypothetical protein